MIFSDTLCSVGKREEREYFEGLGVDGRIILKWLIKTWDGGVDWIDPTQDRDKVRGFFLKKTVMILLFPSNVKNFLTI
jgi:hypothetical protein